MDRGGVGRRRGEVAQGTGELVLGLLGSDMVHRFDESVWREKKQEDDDGRDEGDCGGEQDQEDR